MSVELGHFALILALCLALVQASLPLLGAARGDGRLMAVARSTALGQFVFIAVAFACLVSAFAHDDFSVAYVAANSNAHLPALYKISAVWGAHEGSMLLWVLMLAAWGAAVAALGAQLSAPFRARMLAVLGMVAVGFLSFTLFTSNPFTRLWPAAAEGRSLNPLLQDPGLAIHPPLLYMGYVGFSVAFGAAVAALMGGELDAAWARWARPWTTIAWVFLTLGIALGSWWAYSELGWGGWWFWDPVENASLMPWLLGTALIHSLAVAEKRGAFRHWTVLLALGAFSLSLLGTFLVRSGVLTSVHSFATDPARGIFILIFLSLVVGGSLTLYGLRAPHIRAGGRFALLSRETLLLGNNVLLVTITALVLLGTLFPLIYEAMDWGKISVGFPWFNRMFVLFTPLLFLLMGLAPLTQWKRDELAVLLSRVKLPLLAALLTALACAAWSWSRRPADIGLAMFLAAWIGTTLLLGLVQRLHRLGSWSRVRADVAGGGRSYYGMVVAHLGIAVTIIGVSLVSVHGLEKDVRLAPGAHFELGAYSFKFLGVTRSQGPNYQADVGTLEVSRDARVIATLQPEKRIYDVRGMPMTEAGIAIRATLDLYVSLGEPLDDGAWSLRLYVKPFVRWIWGGAGLMALGGVICLSDRRYRLRATREVGDGAASLAAKS